MDIFPRRIVYVAAFLPYAIYAIYFPLAYACASESPDDCWPLFILLFPVRVFPFLWVGAIAILIFAGTRPPPSRFPSGPVFAFLVSNLLLGSILFGYGKFLEALPVALRNGNVSTATQMHEGGGEFALAYGIFIVFFPMLVSVAGLGWFLWRSPRPYVEKAMTFILFMGTLIVVSVLNLSHLLTFPYYLLTFFWLLPDVVCIIYLRAGRRAKRSE